MTVEHPARQEHISGNDEVGVKKIQFLLDAGGDVNTPNDKRWIPLLEACYWNRPATARLLLENGADVRAIDNSGNTALHFACIYGSVSCVRLLLSHGADVNARNEAGYTPLMRASTATGGFSSVVRLLLSHGADVNARNLVGATSVDLAMQLPSDHPAREEILDLFRQYAPEAVMEAYCSPGPGEMR